MRSILPYLGYVCQALGIVAGIGLTVVVAMQTSRSEGLSGILAGGGGGGGKVGKDRELENWSLRLAYGWLILTALSAWIRHAAV